MTHEQKPESAEFRRREAQIASHFGPHFLADFTEEGLRKELIESEARGVAEQRRKDEEGAEPVGYVRPDMMEFFRQSKALFISASIIPKRDETHTEALYTRPANVAALEDRVEELEGALKEAAYALERVKDGERGGYDARNGKRVSLRMSDGERADIIHGEVTEDCERALEAVRSALSEGDQL